ncbi:hypothetical protein M0638_28135, partial [Roseomonas sp. NAR14]
MPTTDERFRIVGAAGISTSCSKHRNHSSAEAATPAQLPGNPGSLPAPAVGAEDAHTAPPPTTAGEQAEAAIRDRALALAVIRQAIADATATKL